MIDMIKQFFANGSQPDQGGEGGGSGHDLRVATCALFLEIGRIDETFTPEELETLLSILKERYGLSEENADALIEEADRELENAVDYWQFAHLINKNYSVEEKIEIVETLWRIVFVDGKMDRYEHYLMGKLGRLLRLTHDQLIGAKMRVLYPDGKTAEN
jgi:uncharacterized tellurite resistance protein B-like protein